MPLIKRKKIFDSKTPDMFLLSYAALATLLLAFFIVINSFAEEKKKELLEEFRESFKERELSFGLGGLFKTENREKSENIKKMKYIFPENEMKPLEGNDENIDLLDREEAQVPAAAVVYFNDNDSSFSIEGEYSLDNLIELIGDRPCSLIIEGHTRRNFVPSNGYDNCWKLSLDRAKAVADYLHEKGNISMKRLVTVGYGNNKPLTKNIKSDENNDRVSIIINILR
jgi:flagellar motor protein MotB